MTSAVDFSMGVMASFEGGGSGDGVFVAAGLHLKVEDCLETIRIFATGDLVCLLVGVHGEVDLVLPLHFFASAMAD